MFLSRNNSPTSSPNWLERYEKLYNSFLKRTRQLKRANHQLANQVAERQRVEEALRQAEQKYRSIFENAVVGIFQTTPDGHYKACNPALANIYGYESTTQLLTNLTDIGRQLYVDPQRRGEFIEQLQSCDTVSEFESQVYRRDGSIIWICENARAVRNENGKLLYYEGFVTDITQRKLAQESRRQSQAHLGDRTEKLELILSELQQIQDQLIHNEKMSSLGQLVAGVAHEINNPVTFVCNNLVHASKYAEDLLSLLKIYTQHYSQPVPEVQQQAEAIDLNFLIEDFPKTLSSMQIGADRIRQIVQSLHSFSRIDEAQMKQVDLHEGIDNTLLILNNRLKANGDNPGISVVKEYGDLPLVECYPCLLNQVFMNLLCNAVDALEECNQKQCVANYLEDTDTDITSKINKVSTAKTLVSISERYFTTEESASNCLERRWLCPSKSETKLTPDQSSLVQLEYSPRTIQILTEIKGGDTPNSDNQDLRAVIRIRDNGLGMTEEVKARIFAPFFTTKPLGKGTGLGLSITHQIIVEQHNGTLECISAPEQGTEFVIEIPIRQ